MPLFDTARPPTPALVTMCQMLLSAAAGRQGLLAPYGIKPSDPKLTAFLEVIERNERAGSALRASDTHIQTLALRQALRLPAFGTRFRGHTRAASTTLHSEGYAGPARSPLEFFLASAHGINPHSLLTVHSISEQNGVLENVVHLGGANPQGRFTLVRSPLLSQLAEVGMNVHQLLGTPEPYGPKHRPITEFQTQFIYRDDGVRLAVEQSGQAQPQTTNQGGKGSPWSPPKVVPPLPTRAPMPGAPARINPDAAQETKIEATGAGARSFGREFQPGVPENPADFIRPAPMPKKKAPATPAKELAPAGQEMDGPGI